MPAPALSRAPAQLSWPGLVSSWLMPPIGLQSLCVVTLGWVWSSPSPGPCCWLPPTLGRQLGPGCHVGSGLWLQPHRKSCFPESAAWD